MPSGAEPGMMRGHWRAATANGAVAGPVDTAPRPGHQRARELKGARYALWKNPEDLTERQTAKLAWIAAKTDTRLYRAYLLKEGLRHVFSVKGEEGKQALDRWISWGGAAASQCLWSWPAASCDTARPSTPPSTTAYPKD